MLNASGFFDVIDAVEDRATSRASELHGPRHWRTVARLGLRLLDGSAADPCVVLLFALFHDAMRHGDGDDPRHGSRAAALVDELLDGSPLLAASRRAILVDACRRHSDGVVSSDATIAVCWDADRLDLWRVGERPMPERLSTAAARRSEVLAWSRRVSLATAEPWTWPEAVEAYEGVVRNRAAKAPVR